MELKVLAFIDLAGVTLDMNEIVVENESITEAWILLISDSLQCST
jgi:hypothetical protein